MLIPKFPNIGHSHPIGKRFFDNDSPNLQPCIFAQPGASKYVSVEKSPSAPESAIQKSVQLMTEEAQ